MVLRSGRLCVRGAYTVAVDPNSGEMVRYVYGAPHGYNPPTIAGDAMLLSGVESAAAFGMAADGLLVVGCVDGNLYAFPEETPQASP